MDVRRFMDSDEIALLPVFLSSVRNIASRDYTPEQTALVRAYLDFCAEWVGKLR